MCTTQYLCSTRTKFRAALANNDWVVDFNDVKVLNMKGEASNLAFRSMVSLAADTQKQKWACDHHKNIIIPVAFYLVFPAYCTLYMHKIIIVLYKLTWLYSVWYVHSYSVTIINFYTSCTQIDLHLSTWLMAWAVYTPQSYRPQPRKMEWHWSIHQRNWQRIFIDVNCFATGSESNERCPTSESG